MPVSERQKSYLNAMGIPVWRLRLQADVAVETNIRNPDRVEIFDAGSALLEKKIAEPPVKSGNDQNQLINWQALQHEVSHCKACDLHQSRTNTVFGVGNTEADCLIIGEAPGKDEDLQGEPFVGRAGQLLNQMLLAIGLSRESVFIANILKCRPPNNRDPKPEEVVKCAGFLQQQIAFVQPKVILAVGRIAAQNLLQSEEAIGRLRGAVHRLPGSDIPVIATYHPAYLLRSPLEKRKAWADLVLAKRALQGNL